MNGESLYIYLAASEHAINSAIVREEYNIQRPIYYTSKTLDGAESRYLPLEKLAFALVCSAKKLPHFEGRLSRSPPDLLGVLAKKLPLELRPSAFADGGRRGEQSRMPPRGCGAEGGA
jgi:hypothetical protein